MLNYQRVSILESQIVHITPSFPIKKAQSQSAFPLSKIRMRFAGCPAITAVSTWGSAESL